MTTLNTWSYGSGGSGPSTVVFDWLTENTALVTYTNQINTGTGSHHSFSLDAGFGAIDFSLTATHNEACSPLCPDTLSVVGPMPFGWSYDVLSVTVAEASVGYINLWRDPEIPAAVPLPATGLMLVAALAFLRWRARP